MGKNSEIAWTDHTMSPWWGCAKISPGCNNCYAETWAKRTGFPDIWGTSNGRRVLSDKYWQQPLNWDRKAAGAERRPRVFTASMADVFDKNAPDGQRDRLWTLIKATPNLDWLVLTKRIGNGLQMLPRDWILDGPYPNVWLGISVVNQDEALRDIPKLQATPATKRFLSIEPMLGPINLRFAIVQPYFAKTGELVRPPPIDWIIVGGESGTGARLLEADWVRNIRAYCAEHGTAFFMKQGSQANWGKGFKNIETFPVDLQERRWPTPDGR